jgi:hypothetical protein
MHENIKRSSTSKNTRPEATSKEIDQGYFSWDSVFKTLITSRKVSIYCGITFLEVVFLKKREINPFIETRYQCL